MKSDVDSNPKFVKDRPFFNVKDLTIDIRYDLEWIKTIFLYCCPYLKSFRRVKIFPRVQYSNLKQLTNLDTFLKEVIQFFAKIIKIK